MNQLLIFLRLCATGSHLACIADFGGVHVSTTSRIVKRVCRALASKSQRYIKMPQTEEEIQTHQLQFYEIARFPRVIGAVDGSHIRIQSPGRFLTQIHVTIETNISGFQVEKMQKFSEIVRVTSR